MTNAPDIDRLISEAIEGQLNDADGATLTEHLRADPRVADRLRAHLVIAELLCQHHSPSRNASAFAAGLEMRRRNAGTTSRFVRGVLAESTSRRARPALSRRMVMAAAAILLLALGLGWFVLGGRPKNGSVIARLQGSSEGVQVRRGGFLMPAAQPMDLLAEDVVQVQGGSAEVVYADQSSVKLRSTTEVRLWSEGGAKRVDLDHGELYCVVEKQPHGKSMTLRTKQSESEVLGTRFTLRAFPGRTRLDVEEGAVSYRLFTGESRIIRAGESSAPAWVATIGNTWTEIQDSPVFRTWAAANVVPRGGYRGTDPIGAIRDAYTNPIFDPVTKNFAMQGGGGHDAGEANAVITFDANTLTYAIPLQPNLDPLVARPATHLYQAASFHAGIFSIHYNAVGDANVNSGRWTYLQANPYGPQLLALGAAYSDGYLQQGTKCVYDPLLDKDWVTNVPGDIGDNARGHLLLVDRTTHHIDAAIPATVFSCSSICLAGDYVYVFCLLPGDPRQHLVTRVHRTTRAREFITCVGLGMPGFGSAQETVMSFFDGTRIRFWNPGVAADRDAFYALDLTPIGSHVGSSADPLQMSVSREQRGVSALPPLVWTYTLDYIPEWGVAMMLPSSSTRWWAIKLQ